jgi:uncharacterized protein (DUF1800 family)
MSHLDRRAFLTLSTRKRLTVKPVTPAADADAPPALSEILNDRLEQRAAAVLLSGLSPYSGPWTSDEVIHLMRRTMYSFVKADVDHFSGMTMEEAVNELLYAPYTPPPLPVNDYNNPDFIDPNVPFGEVFVNEDYDPAVNEGYRVQSVRAWWTREILKGDRSIREKMTMFWHNHVPIQFYGVFFGGALYHYVNTIRENALGNFKTMMKQITLDPAMLIYLNGYLNSATQPDENYAREIQELFVIGKDLPQYFTEEDVKTAARLLTGWRTNGQYTAFDPFSHDTEDKQFSSFYGSRLIQGQSGLNAGETELNEFLDMLFDQQEAAKYVCRKLYRFFVFHQIDAATEVNVIEPLAQVFRDNNYDILPVLDTLFKSEHFFDQLNRGAILKSPVDFAAGLWRPLKVQLPGNSDLLDNFYIPLVLCFWTNDMLQMPGEPPNVAGWQAYYQKPALDKIWINTSTLPKRGQFTEAMIFVGIYGVNNVAIFDVLEWAKTLTEPSDINVLIDEAVQFMLGLPVSKAVKNYFKSIMLNGLPSDYYWTIAWEAYIANPVDETIKGVVQDRLRAFFWILLQREESQLM